LVLGRGVQRVGRNVNARAEQGDKNAHKAENRNAAPGDGIVQVGHLEVERELGPNVAVGKDDKRAEQKHANMSREATAQLVMAKTKEQERER
jgi:hypothetical protein